ncbi:TPA: hypothetical protein ACKPYC_000668 [Pseudomonas aeruginosa]|uniref:hypothetical protein n=1 Tax=Pseudomonas aeruginosa TaxID=287 RepID=UPI00053EBA86|nr:hypothetical protein [Pseudomonas aeruginosa]AYW41542.1 hypothetical protein DL351_19515 [Pseudomonas aeruginosa]KSG27093.1 hypothetical protein AO946_18630 [Pseudomonas aeruginosa]MCO2635508.1 hypothetical protein [Pseudomonas aeruginosa]MCO2663747.1 hypothetical protein [Pseudomonas aeruginosa]MCS8006746.1 hypothetical protein [Pseudomonas aeruginosa]
MNDSQKSLLVLSTDLALSQEKTEQLSERLHPIAESLGCKPLVLSGGLQVGIHSDIRPLLGELLDEQRKTNQLLHLLIQALAEDGEDPEAMPTSYLDGTSIQGHQPVRSNSLLATPPGER